VVLSGGEQNCAMRTVLMQAGFDVQPIDAADNFDDGAAAGERICAEQSGGFAALPRLNSTAAAAMRISEASS
jgi:hypothetical protein